MNARIASVATYVGRDRNEHGAAIEPCLNEVDMAVKVAHEAMAQLGHREKKPDTIVFATSGIRHVFPSGATAIAEALGVDCGACDITAGCASMGIAVQIGERLGSTSLAVCSDLLSQTIDSNDPSHAPLRTFGDGAAAVVITHDEGPGPKILSYRSKTVGRWRSFYGSTHGRLGRSLPPELKQDLSTAYLQSWTEIGRSLLNQCQIGSDPWVYANQGDVRLFPQLMSNLGLPEDRLIRTGHGHAGGADPWIGLQLNPPPKGSPVLLLSSGIGFTFHGTLLEMA